MKMIKIFCMTAIALTVTMFSGCGSSDSNPDNKDRMFLFGMKNDPERKENFVAVTSDSTVIAAVNSELAKPVDERKLHINGKIAYGNGGHNLEWSWHFTPNQWSLAEMSIELCDGNPSLVEQEIDYWVGTVGRFCPWSSYVKSEIAATQ